MPEIKMNLSLTSYTSENLDDSVYQDKCIEDIAKLLKEVAQKNDDDLIKWIKINFTREVTLY